MSNTGVKTAGSVVSTGSWTGFDTTNLGTVDTSRATNASATYTSGVLRNFNFGVPAGATILGVVVNFYLSTSNSAATAYGKVRISKNAGTNWSSYSTEQSQATTTDTSKTVGGATDMWGLSITAAEINDNTNFYVEVAGYISNTARTCRVTYVGVTVYYKQVYTLDASVTSYTLTGINASFGRKSTMTAQATAYTLTGVNIITFRRRFLNAQATEYALTPVNATFGRRYTLNAQTTSYTLTGVDITVKRIYNASLAVATFALTGIDANFEYYPYTSPFDKVLQLRKSKDGSPWALVPGNENINVYSLQYSLNGSPWAGMTKYVTITWTAKNLKVYIGGAWVTKPLKEYVGGAWTTKNLCLKT